MVVTELELVVVLVLWSQQALFSRTQLIVGKKHGVQQRPWRVHEHWYYFSSSRSCPSKRSCLPCLSRWATDTR
ncbi:MAG: hypothetical protein J3Q66DRAFT_357983 [Benniella sp.]|nr:MAG: hypothetical protein J3Q66DRAFT_357983 [Benniella sp.]